MLQFILLSLKFEVISNTNAQLIQNSITITINIKKNKKKNREEKKEKKSIT